MGHADIENLTPFAFEMCFAADEDGRPLLVPIVKATYTFGFEAGLQLAEKQSSVNLIGELWGEPQISSYKYEPECAFLKPATDVVLIGHAHNTGGEAEVSVRFRLGSLDKTARVVGDRYWDRTLGIVSMSPPEPFERIPLTYERAFGGWDRRGADTSKHNFEARNPVGMGFRSNHEKFEEGTRLPNIEDPRYSIRNYGDTPPPCGFGFTSPEWFPRAKFAGTYDEQWIKDRMPLLPTDFDRRFFNAGSEGLVTSSRLNGNEAVVIENVSAAGRISFNLPGVSPPECRVELARRPDTRMELVLDTVVVNTDEFLLFLLWRGHLPTRNGPHDVLSIQIKGEHASRSLSVESR